MTTISKAAADMTPVTQARWQVHLAWMAQVARLVTHC